MQATIPPHLAPRRADGLEVRPVPDGFVVYDPSRDRLHFLNATAAFVLESCDGAMTVGDLPALVGAAFRLDADPVDEVEGCVQRLMSEGLLVCRPTPQRPGEQV